jgi:hypothetical protein
MTEAYVYICGRTSTGHSSTWDTYKPNYTHFSSEKYILTCEFIYLFIFLVVLQASSPNSKYIIENPNSVDVARQRISNIYDQEDKRVNIKLTVFNFVIIFPSLNPNCNVFITKPESIG